MDLFYMSTYLNSIWNNEDDLKKLILEGKC